MSSSSPSSSPPQQQQQQQIDCQEPSQKQSEQQFEKDAKKYKCLCSGVHVERTVFALTLVSLALALVGVAWTLFTDGPKTGVPEALFDILVFSSVLFAQVMRIPAFYWPFLGAPIFHFVAGIHWAFMYFPVTVSDLINKVHKHIFALGEPIYWVLLVLLMTLSIWIYSLYWRAWRFLANEIALNKQQQQNKTELPHVLDQEEIAD